MMASTSSTGHDTDGEVIAIEDQLVRPCRQGFQEVPHRVSAVMLPRGMVHSLATWLVGFLQYTCGVLGYLGTCLPLVQVNQHEEAHDIDNGFHREIVLSHEPDMLVVDGSNTADREHVLEAKHKVFLSHSGAQKDFVEQLCVDLQQYDRYPFFDKLRSSLPVGEKFPKLIFDAIDQCQVGVLVLSEEFFMKSKWPMLELNAMVKEFEKPNSRMKVIPLFYCISLVDFKDSKNRSRWFSQWEEWGSVDKRIHVEEWKKALRTLESINGLVMKEGMGDVKFRKEIVEEICGMIPRETRWDDSHVQGLSRSCKVICDKMDQVSSSSRACVVGMYGVGGIGKTTICKALCNELSSRFHDNVCHVEFGQGSELKLLQKALKRLTTLNHEMLDKLDLEEGYAYLKKRMQSEPIFLALDNVQDDYKSIEGAHIYLKGGYGVGSIVLVTARSLDVLMRLNLEENQCLEMPELEEDEARSLFLNYANLSFGNGVDEKLLKKCVQLCHLCKADGESKHYHPLALKVLGQQLGSNTKLWEVQLGKMDTIKHLANAEDAIFSIFKNSFESLKQKQKDVFMDLALIINTSSYFEWVWTKLEWLCMVHEESIEDMEEMLEVLKRKSLLEDLSDNFTKIGMHDLWYEFAILESKAQNSKYQRWVYQVDKKRAMGRSGRWRESVERMCFLEEGWVGLRGLDMADFVSVEVFKLNVEILKADCEVDLDLDRLKLLKSLHVKANGLTVRAHGLGALTNLSYLYWSASGISPWLDDIRHLTNLRVLKLINCLGVKILDFTELKLLRAAQIDHFPDLITLRGLSSMKVTLRSLTIAYCKSLQECLGLDELDALEVLELWSCGKLKEVPCLGQLTKLRKLFIYDCKSIMVLPGLGDLVALEELEIWGSSKLSVLPDLVKLTKLQTLDIGDCPMQEVPTLDIGDCPMQEVPGLDGLVALTRLRASFEKLLGDPPVLSNLSKLTSVTLHYWNGPIWMSIQNLLMLENLGLWYCKDGDIMPDLQSLRRLRSVSIGSCNFKDLSGLSNSTTLERLDVMYCDELKRLPRFERLTKLTGLRIMGCDNLSEWPSASNLCSLKQLRVDGLSLTKIVSLHEILSNLRELELHGKGCEHVLKMASLSQLETLTIFNWETTEALDLSSTFPQLKELELRSCSALKRMMCSIPMSSMTKLVVMPCENLVEMPDLSLFPQLEELRIFGCGSLTRLTCSSHLSALREIYLWNGCSSQIELPDLSRFPKLTRRYIDNDEDVDNGDDHEDKDNGDDHEDEDMALL